MESTEKELANQLIEAGNKLLNPPSSTEDLITLLDQVESCLSKVEQSPSMSLLNAIRPSIKVLVSNELLKHLDMDVKVAVASCISEITRITAPEVPYEDEQMKEIFHLIVSTFENFDMANRSYSKRLSILETVARVRSCVLMLDLECDVLIIEMFQHFLKAIRAFHPDSVFTFMETIISLVLEETEDISLELLSPLLITVKKENQDVLPIAQKLAEKVLEDNSAKLKPYLMQIVESMGTLNDYSKIISFICHGTIEIINDNASEHLANENKLPENTGCDEPPQVAKELGSEVSCPGEENPCVDKSPKMIDGISENENDESLVAVSIPENQPKCSPNTNYFIRTELDSSGSKTVKLDTKLDHVTDNMQSGKHNSSMQFAETSGSYLIDSDKGSMELRKSCSNEPSNSFSDSPSAGEGTVHSGLGKEILTKFSSPTTSLDGVNVAAQSPSKSLPDRIGLTRGSCEAENKENLNQVSHPGSPSEPKVALLSKQIQDEATPSAVPILEKESEEYSELKEEPYTSLAMKALSEKANEDKSSPTADVISKESDAISDSEAKRLKGSGMEDARSTEDGLSAKKTQSKVKKARGKVIPENDACGEQNNKSAVKSSKDQGIMEEASQTKAKRKRTPVQEETSEKLPCHQDHGDELVGTWIKVFWPADDVYYKGKVGSFDPVEKKHKVVYVDGDVEILTLENERWQFVEENLVSDEEQTMDLPCADTSEGMIWKRKRKKKRNLDSLTKPLKTDSSLKRGRKSPRSKAKGKNSSNELKDDGQGSRKSEDMTSATSNKSSAGEPKGNNTSKTSSKLKDGTLKADNKSKNDTTNKLTESKDRTRKTDTKSKDITKTGTKSKDEEPRSSTKSKDDKRKCDVKSKNDTKENDAKLKNDTPKVSAKSKCEKTRMQSKGEPTKTDRKSSTDRNSTRGKSGKFKAQEHKDYVEGKFQDEANVEQASEIKKTGKKRIRKANQKLQDEANVQQESNTMKHRKKRLRKVKVHKFQDEAVVRQESDTKADQKLQDEEDVRQESDTIKRGKKRLRKVKVCKFQDEAVVQQESDPKRSREKRLRIVKGLKLLDEAKVQQASETKNTRKKRIRKVQDQFLQDEANVRQDVDTMKSGKKRLKKVKGRKFQAEAMVQQESDTERSGEKRLRVVKGQKLQDEAKVQQESETKKNGVKQQEIKTKKSEEKGLKKVKGIKVQDEAKVQQESETKNSGEKRLGKVKGRKLLDEAKVEQKSDTKRGIKGLGKVNG